MEQHQQQSTYKKRKRDAYCIEYQEYNFKQDEFNKLYQMHQKLLEEMTLIKKENKKMIKELQLILEYINTQKSIENQSNQFNQSNQEEPIDTFLNLDKLTFSGECSYIN